LSRAMTGRPEEAVELRTARNEDLLCAIGSLGNVRGAA
jgi:hypothetical protein